MTVAASMTEPLNVDMRTRVLIVDDDKDFAESVGSFLGLEGYDVATAFSADQALSAIEDFDAEIALLDFRLGATTGLELVEPLKRVRPDLLCILATAYADTDTAVGALRQGVYDFMMKPLDMNQLLATLERCVDRLYLEKEKKAAEEAMLVAMERAEAADRAKTLFLTHMSHELRTPLNAVLGFSEIIKEQAFGPVGSSKYQEYAQDIHGSGQHLLALINDILDLAKIESGTSDLDEEDIDIPGLVRSAVKLVQQRAQSGGLVLEVSLGESLPALRADLRKVRQILINLLANAIRFTEPGGKVEVRAWASPNNGIVFQVIDTGIGIALEDIPKALRMFGQVESDLGRASPGTGLGLSLTKSLAELHGGSLDLQSEVGVGTTVTIRFPAERKIVQAKA
jgi:signal transduction histidine kinase